MTPIVLKSVESLPIEFLKTEEFNLTDDKILNEALRAHRRVRYDLHRLLKPGASLREIIDTVENNKRILLNGEKNNGIGFPCGVSLNDCAPHFTLNPGGKDIILKIDEVFKSFEMETKKGTIPIKQVYNLEWPFYRAI